MSYEQIMRSYYEALVQRDYEFLIKLFSQEAYIEHPIFGKIGAENFLKILLDKSKSHVIEIKNIFYTKEQENRAATYCHVKFTTKDNTEFTENSVHIYDFTKEGLIKTITVVIDTFPFREKYRVD